MVRSKIFVGSLVASTAISATILGSSIVSADTYTKTARIQVTSACTLTGNVATPHSRNVAIATYEYNIGETDFSAVCNDSGGFAVYAIGFTGDTEGNNKLVHSTNSSIYINTGLAESGNTSAWAMKLTAIENAATPTIHNGYSNYSLVPDDYVKVASYPSTTTAAASSMFKSYYAAYVSPTQPAGVYNGKVKYVMVHPSTAAAPTTSFDDAFAAANKTKDNTSGKYKMSDMSTSICAAVTKGNVGQLVDIRDGKVYNVGKLEDGKCWMLDNLALNPLDNNTTMTGDSDTNATTAAVTNFLNGGSTGNTGWTTSAVAAATSTNTYVAPRVYVDNASVVPAGNDDPLKTLVDDGGWKVGVFYNYCAASVGTYCYPTGSNPEANKPNTAMDAEYDICPAGWRLPTGKSRTTGTDSAWPDGGEQAESYDAYVGDEGTGEGSKYRNFRTAFRLPLTGRYQSGDVNYQGRNGYYWSSTYAGGILIYSLNAATSDVYTENMLDREYGAAIRCVAK